MRILASQPCLEATQRLPTHSPLSFSHFSPPTARSNRAAAIRHCQPHLRLRLASMPLQKRVAPFT